MDFPSHHDLLTRSMLRGPMWLEVGASRSLHKFAVAVDQFLPESSHKTDNSLRKFEELEELAVVGQ